MAFSQRTAFGLCAAALIAAAVLAWPRGGDAPAPDGASGSGAPGDAPHGPVDVAHGSAPADGTANGAGGERTSVVPGGGPAAVALVLDANGSAAAGVEVACAVVGAGNGGARRLTDGDGRALFALPRALPSDRVQLRVDGIGCDGARADVKVSDLGAEPVRLQLPPAGFVELRVVQADGSEVGDLLAAGSAVTVRLPDGAGARRPLDAGGRARLGPLAFARSWVLELDPFIAPRLAVRGPTAAQPVLAVDLPLPKDLVIATGHLRTEDGSPAARPAVVEVQAPQRLLRVPAKVDADGRFVAVLGDVAAEAPAPVVVQLADDAERAALQWVRLRPGRCELGTFVLAPMPMLLSGRVRVDGGAPDAADGGVSFELAVLPAAGAERSGAGLRALAVAGDADGAFAARGLFAAGDRVRVQPAAGFAIDAAEFTAGARGVEVLLRRLARLTATVTCAEPAWLDRLETMLVCAEPLAVLPAQPVAGSDGRQLWLGPDGGSYELQVRVRATGEIVALRGGIAIEAPQLQRSRDLGEVPVENLRALRVDWSSVPHGLRVLARLPERQWLALGEEPLLHQGALELLAGGPDFWIEPPTVVGDLVRPAPRRVQPTLFRMPAGLSLQAGETAAVACTFAGEFDQRALAMLAPAPKAAVDEHGVAAVSLPMAGDWHVQATIERAAEPPIRVELPLLQGSVNVETANGRDVVLECDPDQLAVRLRSLRK